MPTCSSRYPGWYHQFGVVGVMKPENDSLALMPDYLDRLPRAAPLG